MKPASNPRRFTQRHTINDALEALGQCHFGRPFLPISVTNHIDGFDGALNDGITWLRGESGIPFGSRRIAWRKYAWSVHKC